MNSIKRGFTLVELLVVIAMIAILTGAMSSAMSGAQTRARIQKATNDVKVLTQAILAYENYDSENELEPVGGLGSSGVDVTSSSIGFLLGSSTENGYKVPTLVMAALGADGYMRDPWGTPYKLHIREGNGAITFKTATSQMQTGFYPPNFYRLGRDERAQTAGGGNP